MTYKELENIKDESVFIFGAGLIGRTFAYDMVSLSGHIVEGYFDNKIPDGTIVDTGKKDIKVFSLDYLYREKNKIRLFLAVGDKNQKEIIKKFKKYGIEDYIVIDFFALQEFAESVLASGDEGVIERYKVIVDDAEYLKRQYKVRLGERLNLEHPRGFNEKIQWLKLHDRQPGYVQLVDKYAVKELISKTIGEKYVVPTLGVWNHFDDIDFETLPNEFVLKCTHDSGSVVVVKDKKNMDKETVKEKLERALSKNWYWGAREWPYKNVTPRIMAEKYLKSNGYDNLIVYKFMCFNGVPKIIQVIQDDKTKEESIDYFDVKWNLLDMRQGFPNSKKHLSKPHSLSQMIKLAADLSKGIRFVRVDFFEVDNSPVFSEFTFYSDAGFSEFKPKCWGQVLGDYISI